MSALPRLDRDRIRADAEKYVQSKLRYTRGDPQRIVEAAASIVNDERDRFAQLRQERDDTALSLAFYDGVEGLNVVIGVNRTRWIEIRYRALGITPAERKQKWLANATPGQVAARAKQHGVARIPQEEALAALPDLSVRAAHAEEVRKAAEERRDAQAVALLGKGFTRDEVAKMIGRNPSRVSHLKAKEMQPA